MKRFLALLLVLLTLSGCSGFANKDNIINLLSSPKLSQRESEIVESIKAHLGRDIILKYPKQGENVSPVQITDLSGDGTDQAVVLYTAPGQGGNVRMAVLTASDEGWRIDYDSEGYGTEFYKIIFANLDGEKGICPARKVQVKDTTGAGDSFCAGVAIGLTYGKNLKEACRIGSMLAASVIVSSENVCPRFLPRELGLDMDVTD